MAQIIGGLATSHAPQLLMPALQWSDLPTRTKGPFNPKPDIAKELTDETKLANQARCNKAIGALRAQLEAWAPDAVVVMGDDQHENILDDNQPPFLLYLAPDTDATLHFNYLGVKSTDQTKASISPGRARTERNMVLGTRSAGHSISSCRCRNFRSCR
jgi:hypothetical protein